jgi:hypothetical protein
MATPGVYAELHDLIRLRAHTQGFSFLPRQPIHSLLAGRHASRLRGRGLDFAELRRYLPGDDVRTIDWRVTARTEALDPRLHRGARPAAAARRRPAPRHVLRQPACDEVGGGRGDGGAGGVAVAEGR